MDLPAFAAAPAMSWWKRKLVGFVCAVLSLAVLVAVCHFLEHFREQVERDRPSALIRKPAPPPAAQRPQK